MENPHGPYAVIAIDVVQQRNAYGDVSASDIRRHTAICPSKYSENPFGHSSLNENY
jgi:hypothetical protein